MESRKHFTACFLVFIASAALIPAETGPETVTLTINDIICIFIQLVEMVAVGLAVLMLILAGVRFLTAEDAAARGTAKNWIINTFVGLVIILIAIPIIDYATARFTSGVECSLLPKISPASGEKQKEPGSGLKSEGEGENPLVGDKPDLYVPGLNKPPKGEITKDSLPLYVAVANQGKLGADPFETLLVIDTEGYLDPNAGRPQCSVGTQKTLAAGEKTILKCVFKLDWNLANTLLAEGGHYVTAQADYGNAVDESDEGNNMGKFPLDADLVPIDLLKEAASKTGNTDLIEIENLNVVK